MNFNSLSFILLFLPTVVLVHALIKPVPYKNIFLVAFSLFFYLWGSYNTFILFLMLSVCTYLMGLYIDKGKYKKTSLYIYSFIVVGTLAYYKYFDFGIRIVNKIFNSELDFLYLALPLGISFFTFQSIAYILDIYSGKNKAEKNLLDFFVFSSLFATVTSGPILRFEQIASDIKNRDTKIENISEGFQRFIFGLSKKVVLANNIAIIADLGFRSTDLANLPWQVAWLSAIAYTFQIYFDFSGYSDMAIGIGKMLGFSKIKENFDYPYASKSISEFWRRWHISLGSWFRDYIYIPLGGNRVSKLRWFLNIATVWLLTGLWHGASLVFVLWGAYFGVLLVLEKYIIEKVLRRVPSIFQRIYTIICIVFGWIMFNSPSMDSLFLYIKALFRTRVSFDFNLLLLEDVVYLWPIVVACIIFSFPIFPKIEKYLSSKRLLIIKDFVTLGLLCISIIFLVNSSYSPFIYFNF